MVPHLSELSLTAIIPLLEIMETIISTVPFLTREQQSLNNLYAFRPFLPQGCLL